MLRSLITQGNESSCGMRPNRRRARWGRSSITILVIYSIRAASDAAALASKTRCCFFGVPGPYPFRALPLLRDIRGDLTGRKLGGPSALEDILPCFLRTEITGRDERRLRSLAEPLRSLTDDDGGGQRVAPAPSRARMRIGKSSDTVRRAAMPTSRLAPAGELHTVYMLLYSVARS